MALLAEGTQIRDTYEVERFLGEGAFAEVYRVNHRFLGRQAMKVFKQTVTDVDEVEKMLGEAILLSKIGHPNIVRVFDANVVDTKQGLCGFFTMEYVPGGTPSPGGSAGLPRSTVSHRSVRSKPPPLRHPHSPSRWRSSG